MLSLLTVVVNSSFIARLPVSTLRLNQGQLANARAH